MTGAARSTSTLLFLQRRIAASSPADFFTALLPGRTAAVSILGDSFGVHTLAATSTHAAACAGAQIDLDKGPIWTARALRQPVLMSDAITASTERWPPLTDVLLEHDVRSLFAFDVGVVSLYATHTRRTVTADLHDTFALVRLVAHDVLRRALDEAETPSVVSRGILSRKEVHQATRIILARPHLSADEALLHMRAHAHATGTTVRAVAHAILTRRLDPALFDCDSH
jgi:hypothetical protein